MSCQFASAQVDSLKPVPADSLKPTQVDSSKTAAPVIDSTIPKVIPTPPPAPAAAAKDMGTIKGIITDEKNGSPMTGVNVSVKGVAVARTDENGVYQFQAQAGVITSILFTYVGYRDRTADIIAVKDGVKTYNIKMTDTTKEFDIVVVSGNKIEKKLGEQTQSMEVLKGENITNSAQGLGEAMNKVPGVNMLGKTISIRGGSGFADVTSNRTLVLLDEVPLVSPENGSVRWETMPTEAIEQLEIVKGPATVTNGAQALNALVNVKTINAQKDEPYNKIFVNMGGYLPFQDKSWTWFYKTRWDNFKKDLKNNWSATLPNSFYNLAYVHARKYGDVDVVFNTAISSNGGYTLQNRNQLVRAFVKLRYIPHKLQNLAVGGNINFCYNRYDDFFIYQNYGDTSHFTNGNPRNPTYDSLVLVPNDPHLITTYALNINPYITYRDKTDGKHAIRTSYYYVQSNSTSGDSSIAHKLYLEYVYTHKFKKADADIAAGVRYAYKRILSQTFGNKYSHYGAVYVQGEKRFDKRFTVKVGISFEYNKLDTISVRNDLSFLNVLAAKDSAHRMSAFVKPVVNIGLNYQVSEGTFLRASFGQGYRFPDIAEQFVLTPRSGILAVPNPDLKPESSWSAEVGIKQGMKFSRWIFYADLAAYLSRYNNLIEFITITQVPDYIKQKYPKYQYGPFEQAQNITRAQIWGIEVSAIGTGAIFGVPLNFLIGYNYMAPQNLNYNPNDPATKQYLYYRMRHSAKADIQTTYKGFIIGFTGVYIGHILQLDQIASLSKIQNWTNTHSAKGDFVIDARFGYNWKDRFTATVIAKNITNHAYTLRPGFVEAPANLTLQLTYHWGKIFPKKKTEETPAGGA